jgi:LacI family gluconate utilization system Gnt-I transcriptional repressor
VKDRVRLRDIAARTGFSVMTVQRAVADPDRVAKDTLEKILKVMDEVGYISNRNASNLKGQTSSFIGLVVSSVTSMGFLSQIQGVADFCSMTGKEMLIWQTAYDYNGEYEVLRSVLERWPAGIILTFSPSEERSRQLLKRSAIPIVETFEDPRDPIDMVVGFSNTEAARSVARHFAETGRKSPAFFGQLIGRDKVRWEAFAEECRKLIGCDPVHIPIGTGTRMEDENFNAGVYFLEAYKRLTPRIDAVYCALDVTAMAVASIATRHKINVPDELAICGFGDLPFAAHMIPSLTTVRVPGYEIGQAATRMIVNKATFGTSQKRLMVSTELVKREST